MKSVPLTSGIYTANWRQSGADWVIEAEYSSPSPNLRGMTAVALGPFMRQGDNEAHKVEHLQEESSLRERV